MEYKSGIKARVFIYVLFYIFLFFRAAHGQDKLYPNEFPLAMSNCWMVLSNMPVILISKFYWNMMLIVYWQPYLKEAGLPPKD